jgi:hypothetical protein
VRLAQVRFAAVAQSAVEAGRFCFIEAEQPVALAGDWRPNTFAARGRRSPS